MVDIPILTSQKFSHIPFIKFGFSTRNGGVSPVPLGMNLSFNVGDVKENVSQNRDLFFNSVGIATERVAFPLQCHSNIVLSIDEPGQYQTCDGLATSVSGLALAVSAADCVPVFLVDPKNKAIAAVHAGWRGTAQSITEHAISLMGKEFKTNPQDVVAFIGPAASECCYEVGREVADQIDPNVVISRNGKIFLNLKEANKKQLIRMNISENNIEVSSYCTICSPDLLHSYRRDKAASGRMMGVIMLTHQ